jgi:TolB-like protein
MAQKLFSVLIVFLAVTLHALSSDTLYRDNAAAYVNKVAKTIVSNLNRSPHTQNIKSQNLAIEPIYNIDDTNTTLPITKRIEETLFDALSKNSFKVIDIATLKKLNQNTPQIDFVLISTYTIYKYEMVINSRIVQKKDGNVVATSQVVVPRRTLRDVEKLYTKDRWFK